MANGSEIDATTMPVQHSSTGYGAASISADPEGNPLKLSSRPGAKLLSLHAPSRYVIDVPEGAVRFLAEGTLSEKALAQKNGGTVEFELYGIEKIGLDQQGLAATDFVARLAQKRGKLLPIWPQRGATSSLGTDARCISTRPSRNY